MLACQSRERFLASRNDGRLPIRNRTAFQPGGVREVARCSARGCGKPLVRLKLHENALRLSGHGNSPEERRRLPGNRDSNRDHPRPDARCADPCRSCSTSHKYTALPACRTWCNERVRAWGLQAELYLSMAMRGKARFFTMRRVLTRSCDPSSDLFHRFNANLCRCGELL